MRRALTHIIFTIATIGALLNTSCRKQESMSFDVPQGSILVSMPGERGTTTFDSKNITSITATSTPTGWKVNDIDMYKGTITVTAPSTFENGEVYNGDITLKGYSPIGSTATLTIYVAILPNADIDFSTTPANCFVATQPATRYHINPYIGGTATPLATADVKLLWQSRKGLIKFLDMRNDDVTFYLAKAENDEGEEIDEVYEGNALIGAYDASGKLIWSWHVWVTNNKPESSTVNINGRTMMNVNLGASCNSEGSTDHDKILGSYGLFYQWGRKAPIVGPYSWNFNGNEDGRIYDVDGTMLYYKYATSTAEHGTTTWSNENPISIILGNPENSYNWLFTGNDDTLWSDTSKTEQDPCPYGWRVADSETFATLTIAAAEDDLPWEEAQPMCGWRLTDAQTSQSYFFSAAGRRNYIDGRLDIVNDDEIYPIPWSGYYWSSTTDGAMAKALYFDLNTATRAWNAIEVARPMQRANAMPVRCIRE